MEPPLLLALGCVKIREFCRFLHKIEFGAFFTAITNKRVFRHKRINRPHTKYHLNNFKNYSACTNVSHRPPPLYVKGWSQENKLNKQLKQAVGGAIPRIFHIPPPQRDGNLRGLTPKFPAGFQKYPPKSTASKWLFGLG